MKYRLTISRQLLEELRFPWGGCSCLFILQCGTVLLFDLLLDYHLCPSVTNIVNQALPHPQPFPPWGDVLSVAGKEFVIPICLTHQRADFANPQIWTQHLKVCRPSKWPRRRTRGAADPLDLCDRAMGWFMLVVVGAAEKQQWEWSMTKADGETPPAAAPWQSVSATGRKATLSPK